MLRWFNFIFLLFFSFYAGPLYAQVDLSEFRKIAIQDAGRIKPLDTYAQHILLQFSGKRSFEGQSAIHWLARLLFKPETTIHDKIFLINHPDIPVALGVVLEPKHRYSLSQLEKSYHKLEELAVELSQIEEKNQTVFEKEIIRVFANIQLYLKLSNSFQFAFPHSDFSISNQETKRILQLPDKKSNFSFVDIAQKADILQKIVESIHQKPSVQWSTLEREVLTLVTNLFQWSQYYQNMPFAIIPPFEEGSEQWLSPWDALGKGFSQDEIRGEILFLDEMTGGFNNSKPKEFNGVIKKFNNHIQGCAQRLRQVHFLSLEVMYNQINFLRISLISYVIALCAIIFSFLKYSAFWRKLSFGLLLAGFLSHVTALAIRITILGRPPVSSLYETFIFVSAVAIAISLLIEASQKQSLGIFSGSFLGTVLLIIATKFSSEGDTMKMLVAVLNSNFWLSIHVPNITMGYAACCLAGVLGHVYILQSFRNASQKDQLAKTYQALMGTLALGLILSFSGTMLGGIWADQSWGRFWGWDPKENGALMIVLWCAIIFHAKIARLIGPLGVAAGSVLLLTVVMWAWFGVNFLSVGLHSYGFTSGVAWGLGAFVAGEILFLLISVPLAKRKLAKV